MQKKYIKTTWADVVIVAIQKGLLLPMFLMLGILIMLRKIPGQDITPLINQIIKNLKDFFILGYLLFFISVILWYIVIVC